jgi:hypothetical protein
VSEWNDETDPLSNVRKGDSQSAGSTKGKGFPNYAVSAIRQSQELAFLVCALLFGRAKWRSLLGLSKSKPA